MLARRQRQQQVHRSSRSPQGNAGVPAKAVLDYATAAATVPENMSDESKPTLEARLADLQKQHGQLHRELFDAEQVQRRLCAPRELRLGAFDIASEVFPVRYLSGDFYDVVEVDGKTVLAVGDIAGKGVAASLWFAHLVSLVRFHAGAISDPAATLAAINYDLMQLRLEPPMASVFLGRLDARRGELSYCNAGHPPSLVLRRDGTVDALGEGGPLLGALLEASFDAGQVALQSGDSLIGYSDGIVECRNASGEEFGVERLLAAARRTHGSSAKAMLFSILGAAQDFAGGCPREDDFTLMVAHHL